MEQKRHEALSIPNLITYFRLLLIPVFVLAYFEERYVWAVACLALSGLSDVADGFIARRCNMVTDLGKVLDPVADKLTQAAMIFCVAWHIPAMWILLALLTVKELVMLFWGWYALRRTGTVNSSKWYGKVCTFVLYASMAVFVVWPDIPRQTADIIAAVCGGMMLMSLILYSRWYIRFVRSHSTETARPVAESSVVRSNVSLIVTGVIIVVILVCAVLAFVYRGDLTLENIVSFTPKNLWLAALVFMGLYAAKSLTVVVYMKLLYAAAGVVFPLPAALAVNLAGTAIEMSIPYALGRVGGKGTAEAILRRWPKLGHISALRRENNLWFSILLRAVGFFPADPLSAYLGACGMPYRDFLAGGLMGTLPSMIITTILGAKAEDPGSPGFILAAAAFVAVQASAAAFCAVKIRKNQSRKGAGENEENEPSQ